MEKPAFPEKNTGSAFADVKAGHIGILTFEYDAIVKWYRENLDFRLVREWTNDGLNMQLAFLAPPDDNSFVIEIFGYNQAETAGNAQPKPGYNHICFDVANLDRTMAELHKRNINIVRSFSIPAIGRRVAFIADPWGNTIEFSEDIS